jgi:hypothetical protein
MAKKQDPLQVALAAGRDFTWTIPEGGDLASMREAVRHGQTITMSPVSEPDAVEVGDIVLVKWHGGTIFHLVGEKRDGEFLIVNSLGKVNGWVRGDALLGRVTQVIDPPPRPSVPDLLDQLETSYRSLIAAVRPSDEDARRLLAVVHDLRWYEGRLGDACWDTMPRSNIWSFHQNLWRLVRRAESVLIGQLPESLDPLIDRGKSCVGAAARIVELLDSPESH